MTWFKVDDKLHDHRKARAAGPTAMGVWLMAGSWSAANLTDGFVPSAILTRWGRQRDAARLVEVGLWYADEHDGEKGWRFHQWAEFQPTRAKKLAEREERAKAGRAGGLVSGRSRSKAKSEANSKQFASGEVEPPSRPVPSRTTTTSEVADATPDQETRQDVERLCTRLADRIEGNGAKRPNITKAWRDATRLLLDKDGHTEQQVGWLIDWCQRDEFWRSNILSMPKFREKFDQLRLRATGRSSNVQPIRASQAPSQSWMKRRPADPGAGG